MADQTLFERDGMALWDNTTFTPVTSAFGDDKMAVVGQTPSGWGVQMFRANVNGSVDVKQTSLDAAAPTTTEYFSPQMLVVEDRVYVAFRAVPNISGQAARAVVFTYAIGSDLTLTLINTRNHQEPQQPVNRVWADPLSKQFLISTYDSVRTGTQIIRAQANGPVDRLLYSDSQTPMPPSGGQHRYYTALPYWQNDVLLYNSENNADRTMSFRWKIGRTTYNSVGQVSFATGGLYPEVPPSDTSQPSPFLFLSPTHGAMKRDSDGQWYEVDLSLGQYPSSAKTLTMGSGVFNPAIDGVPITPQVQQGIDTIFGVGKEVDGPGTQMVIRRDIFDPTQNLYGPPEDHRPRWAYRTSQGKWLVYSTNGTQVKVSQWGDLVPLALAKNPYRGSKYFLFTSSGGTTETSLTIRGPLGDRMYADRHQGSFLISPNRMVSMQFRVASVSKIVVDVYAQWLRVNHDAFVRESQDAMVQDFVVEYTDNPDVWSVISAFIGTVPANVSHWRPRIVFSRLVDGVKVPLTAGQQVALDSLYVSENGRPLAAQQYLDGDQPGGRWEGEFHNSPSVRGMPDPVSGPNIAMPEAIVVFEGEGGGNPTPDDLVDESVGIQV